MENTDGLQPWLEGIMQAAVTGVPGEVVDCDCPAFYRDGCLELTRLGDCRDPNYTQKRATA